MYSTLYIAEIILGFGLTIAVHEFGHFLAAKLSGVRVEKFALGFGPPLIKFVRGETEYSLRLIPLGGYVSMPGETHASPGAEDPRALVQQPVHRRAIIFSAGVVMNLVLATILFCIAFPLGVEQPAPNVGSVKRGFGAEGAGIKPGDRIVELNGMKVHSFGDMAYEVAMANAGTSFTITVERMQEDGTVKRIKLTDVKSKDDELYPIIGIGSQIDTLLKSVEKDSEAWQIGLRAGDRVVAVGGKRVAYWQAVAKVLAAKGDSPLELTIVRDGQEMVLKADPAKIKRYSLGFEPLLVVSESVADGPAKKAGFKKGDVIRAVGERQWPSIGFLRKVLNADKGDGVDITVLRKGKKLTLHVVPREFPNTPGRLIMNVRFGAGYAESPPKVGHVDAEGPAAKAGLKSGDVITLLNGKKDKTVTDMLVYLLKSPPKPMKLVVARNKKILDLTLKPTREPIKHIILIGVMPAGPVMVTLKELNPVKAIGMGVGRTWRWVKHTYMTLKQTVVGNVSPKAVSGPVGIARMAYGVAEKGPGTLLWFFAIINVALAVFNFLPIPVLDGGHMAFLVIEKIRGKPLSLRVQAIATVVGLVLILSLVLAVTYKDIMMIFQ
ncbi:MAG: RIP metalloprotease RseP [Planctomycetia bacterium]|nr:RIP metalloprotease RseP [Planctomycetia bacterium]